MIAGLVEVVSMIVSPHPCGEQDRRDFEAAQMRGNDLLRRKYDDAKPGQIVTVRVARDQSGKWQAY